MGKRHQIKELEEEAKEAKTKTKDSGKQEQITEIEDEIRKTKYNKATQKHIGALKAKLAKLRQDAQKTSGGPQSLGYGIKKSGDATLVLVGYPSVGKSTILNKLTDAKSKVAHYEFTTTEVVPGVMKMNGASIQMLDVPGLIEGVSSGKGRGKEVLSVVRIADLILFVLDNKEPEKRLKIMKKELYNSGFRLNQKKPNVKIEKKSVGGINVESTVKLTKTAPDEIKAVAGSFGIYNADILIRDDITADEFIDALLGNRSYVPMIVLLNKTDMMREEEVEMFCLKNQAIPISAEMGEHLEDLKNSIWENLGLIRIYLKRLGKEPDMKEPIIMKNNSMVSDVAKEIHKVFKDRFTFARIWGPSAKFPGQRIGPEHMLQDKDIVELHSNK
ncbi:MAG: GTP-binding protein [Nanoarchaeota archaeon]|nr:GTP-binding protein [Nanoarchaeota archaeon]MBU1135417.1 GTP-binding protein [Nanoarchaeota archaeon]MBU2520456.1 GTP-binding protein [Nanoarchaeota archaeon]